LAATGGGNREAGSDRLTWNFRTLPEAYDKTGSKNRAWNEPARKALDGFARLRATEACGDETLSQLVATNCAAAVAAGCDDPMVAYLNARYLDKQDRPAYWKRPEVWPDIKASFDKFLQLNPDAVGWYHNYALYAYRCEQWDALNELIPKLGPVNYGYFGGKEEYDEMVRLAKENSARLKTGERK
jgi:hypothetical protein